MTSSPLTIRTSHFDFAASQVTSTRSARMDTSAWKVPILPPCTKKEASLSPASSTPSEVFKQPGVAFPGNLTEGNVMTIRRGPKRIEGMALAQIQNDVGLAIKTDLDDVATQCVNSDCKQRPAVRGPCSLPNVHGGKRVQDALS